MQIYEKVIKILNSPPRYHNRIYEKRVRIDGISVYASSRNREECETKFLADLTAKILDTNSELSVQSKSRSKILFRDVADQWFEEVFKPDVTPQTYIREYGRFKLHIFPSLERKTIRQVLPIDLIRIFNNFKEKQIERTAESCYSILKRIFDYAVLSEMITKNPMVAIKPIKHERENGIPLSREEEKAFLARIKGMKYEAVFILALYTGLRPCEYETAKIDGQFIIAQNRKRKNVQKIEMKKIPITPMLRPYLPLVEAAMPNWQELTADSAKRARWQFQETCPHHRLYDLRTTFATRTQECGVSETVVQVWMGHSPRTLLGRVYTKYSDEHLLSEGEKFKY